MKNIDHQVLYSKLSSRPGVVLVKVPNISTSIASLWFQAGSRYVQPGKDGLSHLFEHLFIVSNKRYPEKKEFLVETEKTGLLYKAYTFRDLVTYYFVCSPGNEILALRQLIDAYRTSIITQKLLNHEKKVVENEEKRNHVTPANYIWRLVSRALWQKTDLASDTLGLPQTINSITLQDIRSFQKRFYQPNNMSILVITPQDLELDKIQPILSPLGKYKTMKFPRSKFFSVKKTIHENREIENLHVALAYRYDALSFKERVTMHFISYYLTGGWSAKLIQSLRTELGLTYWVNGTIFNTYDSGFMGFYYTVKKGDFKHTINLVKNEVKKVRSKKIKARSLENYKRLFLVITGRILDNPYRLFYYYGRFILPSRNHIYLYKEIVDIIRKLTPEEIQKVAIKHLKEKNSTVATIGSRDFFLKT